MDPVTHGLAGAVIRQLGFKRKGALGLLVLSSMAPDLDYVTMLRGPEAFLRYHRGLSHGVLALLAFSLLAGFIFRRRGFVYYSFIAFLGYSFHMLLDLTNQYGTSIFAPLDWQRRSLGLTFVIDPYISAFFLLAVLFALLQRDKARTWALAAFLLLVSYIGVRDYFHDRTEDFLRSRMDEYICRLSPLPTDVMRWWFVAESGDKVKVGFADLFFGRVYVQDSYVRQDGPAVRRSREEEVVRAFLDSARFPYAEVQKHGGKVVVTWKELAYGFGRGRHFEATVVMDEQGGVLSAGFVF
jgi:inner membrane protein